MEHKNQKENVKIMIFNAQLSTKNKVQVTGTMATPVHSFRITNWHQEETQKLGRKTRKMLTIHGQHHQRADIDRLYVPRKEGRRGLMQIDGAEFMKLMEYAESKEHAPIQVAGTHQHHRERALLKAVENFKKSFHKATKKIKYIKEDWKEKKES